MFNTLKRSSAFEATCLLFATRNCTWVYRYKLSSFSQGISRDDDDDDGDVQRGHDDEPHHKE